MNLFLLRICLGAVTLVHVDSAREITDLHDFVKIITSENGHHYEDSGHGFEKDILMTLLLEQTDSDEKHENRFRLRLEDLFDETLKEVEKKSESYNTSLLRNGAKQNSSTQPPTPKPTTVATRLPKWKKKTIKTTQPRVGIAALSEGGRRAHERRIKEIAEHMQEHFMSSVYFYNEVKRILMTQRVMDELRVMAVVLEMPDNRSMRRSVLKCFGDHTPPAEKPEIIRPTNNLIIDIHKDAINDGVIV